MSSPAVRSDHEAARTELGVPGAYDVEAMVAIGEPAPPETLPDELQEREQPSGRKPLAEIVHEGSFAQSD